MSTFLDKLQQQERNKKLLQQERNKKLFSGEFDTEKDGLEVFDRLIERTGMFAVHREVSGHYIAIRPGCTLKKPRIDRVLVPCEAAVAKGFDRVVGVEGKCSGDKFAPAITQCIDYSYAVFDVGIYQVSLGAIFLWPIEPQVNAIASVAAQNRIGTATPFGDGFGLKLQYASKNVLKIYCSEVTIRAFPRAGNRQGSR